MRFSLFQFQMTREYAEVVNAVGWETAIAANPEIMIHREVKFGGSAEFQPWMFDHYQVVAQITANGLDEVFHIGNGYGDQDKIVRLERMHSMSVGDVVLCHDTNTYFMCDPMGWTAVDIKEAA